MRQLLLKLANDETGIVSTRLRSKRFTLFKEVLATVSKPAKILDVGGRPHIWEREGIYASDSDYSLTLINAEQLDIQDPNIISLAGDARYMHEFKDNEFDIVFSNSVIEHVGDYNEQKKMADEVRRIGKRYFIQTPNRYFPIEPHFLFPFFQFFPLWLKMILIRSFSLGNRGRASNMEEAKARVSDVKLLGKREFKKLFPDANFFEEKVFGLTKSFIAYK